MLKDWNFWCSVITALTAILALVLSVRQISLSNKHQLFDRRMEAYMLTNGLIALCKDNYMWLSPKREQMPQFANDYVFIWLTNNTYMEKQADAIEYPLEQPFHKEFLQKREEIRITAAEIDLIFKIAEVGIVVSILNQVLVRSGREEQATMTSLAALVVVLMIVVQRIAELFEMVKTLFEF